MHCEFPTMFLFICAKANNEDIYNMTAPGPFHCSATQCSCSWMIQWVTLCPTPYQPSEWHHWSAGCRCLQKRQWGETDFAYILAKNKACTYWHWTGSEIKQSEWQEWHKLLTAPVLVLSMPQSGMILDSTTIQLLILSLLLRSTA